MHALFVDGAHLVRRILKRFKHNDRQQFRQILTQQSCITDTLIATEKLVFSSGRWTKLRTRTRQYLLISIMLVNGDDALRFGYLGQPRLVLLSRLN